MARIRSVKPDIFKNEDLIGLGYASVMLFIGLFQHADMAGRGEDRPGRLKAEVFPYTNEDVDALMDGLERARFITRYEADGEQFYWVRKFREHQRITGKEAETGSKRPPAPDDEDGPRLPVKPTPTPPVKPLGSTEEAPGTQPGSAENLPEKPPGNVGETSGGFSGVLEGKGREDNYYQEDREEPPPSDSSGEEPSGLTDEERRVRFEAFWAPAGKHPDPVVKALCRSAYNIPKFNAVVPPSIATVEKVVARLRTMAPHDAAILSEIEEFDLYWSSQSGGGGKNQWWLKLGKWCDKCAGKWAVAKRRGGLMPVEGGRREPAREVSDDERARMAR